MKVIVVSLLICILGSLAWSQISIYIFGHSIVSLLMSFIGGWIIGQNSLKIAEWFLN